MRIMVEAKDFIRAHRNDPDAIDTQYQLLQSQLSRLYEKIARLQVELFYYEGYYHGKNKK